MRGEALASDHPPLHRGIRGGFCLIHGVCLPRVRPLEGLVQANLNPQFPSLVPRSRVGTRRGRPAREKFMNVPLLFRFIPPRRRKADPAARSGRSSSCAGCTRRTEDCSRSTRGERRTGPCGGASRRVPRTGPIRSLCTRWSYWRSAGTCFASAGWTRSTARRSSTSSRILRNWTGSPLPGSLIRNPPPSPRGWGESPRSPPARAPRRSIICYLKPMTIPYRPAAFVFVRTVMSLL